MSINYLKRYIVTLETIGPLFIGSGDELNKKEWIYDRNREEALILNQRAFMTFLRRKGLLDKYELFLQDNRLRLREWLKDMNISLKEIDSAIEYRLDCSNVDMDKAMDLKKFIKDGHGKPYIPGSSLKGYIRTALLAEEVRAGAGNAEELTREAKNQSGRSSKQYLRREAGAISESAFYTLNRSGKKKPEAVDDYMSAVSVSDSAPLSLSDLFLARKTDMPVEGKASDLPLYRECLKPGTKIEFELTIDRTLVHFDGEYIASVLRGFLIDYNEMFLSKFKGEKLYSGNVLYLGGGAGYASKTVSNVILAKRQDRVATVSTIIENTLSKEAKSGGRKDHKHSLDKNYGVSPHIVKLAEYDRDLLQMGACKFEIRPL